MNAATVSSRVLGIVWLVLGLVIVVVPPDTIAFLGFPEPSLP